MADACGKAAAQSPRFGTLAVDSRSRGYRRFRHRPFSKWINIPETTSLSRREQPRENRHNSCDDEIERCVESQNLTVCHVRYRPTRTEGGRWRPAGSKARLRRAGPGDLIGAMVAHCKPATPAEPGFCHASYRNRRAGPANAVLVPGDGRRCAERLPSAPTPGSGCRHPDAANHLITTAFICAYPDRKTSAAEHRATAASRCRAAAPETSPPATVDSA